MRRMTYASYQPAFRMVIVPAWHLALEAETKWSVRTQVGITYTATIIIALAAWNAQRPDLMRSPKRVLAHLWEDSEL